MSTYPSFSQFADEKLKTPSFTPTDNTTETQAFIASKDSALDLMRWTRNAINVRHERFHLQAGFIDTMEPNAFADIYSGSHFIGINQALHISIMDFALFALTQRYLFPQIGNASAETSPKPKHGAAPGLFVIQKTLTYQTVNTETDQHRVPVDAVRHEVAIYLGILMSRFVWFHELAHCYNGHVLLRANKKLPTRIYEMEPAFTIADLTEDDTALRLGLEYDADYTAFLGLCRVQLFNSENLEGLQRLDAATRLGLSIFAAYAMTWLFEEYRHFYDRDVGDSSKTHPAPYDRLTSLSHYAAKTLASEHEGFVDFHDSICQQFNQLAQAIPTLHQIEPVGRNVVLPEFTPEKRQHLEEQLSPYRFYAGR